MRSKTYEKITVFVCPRCESEMDLEEINCFVCGYQFPIQDDEEGLDEYEYKKIETKS
jgi:hypothetical protein